MFWIMLLLVIWLLLLVVANVYELSVAADRTRIILRIVAASALAGLIYLTLFFIFSRPIIAGEGTLISSFSPLNLAEPPRLLPALILLIGVPLLLTWRVAYVQFFTNPVLRRRALVVGAGEVGRDLTRSTGNITGAYQYVGFVDHDPKLHGYYAAGHRILGGYGDLVHLVTEHHVDEIVVAQSNTIEGELFRALSMCHEQGVAIKSSTRVYEEVLGQVPAEYLGPGWFFASSASHFPTVYRIVKRLLDLAVGVVGMLILLTLLPFIALAIYLDSPGPIFYRQERSGLSGKPFLLYKFRSMVPNAEKLGKAQWATKHDPRITRIGRFMRLTRIDELPQFINIFRGDMSVVGPRPERPEFVAELEQQIPYYRARLSVKPGLTGWAQVRYRYGNTVEDALVKLKYDLYYIKNRSFLLDTLIIFRTVGVVLTMRGT
jgi:exopolysaccharide biosynthesis polyprenyl glycosylphosphotransferase